MLMEPGVRRLRRAHDRVTHSARRFSVGDLRAAAVAAGSKSHGDGAYSFLVPPAAAKTLLERGRSTSDLDRHGSGLGGVLGGAAALRASRAAEGVAPGRAVGGRRGPPPVGPGRGRRSAVGSAVGSGRQGSWATACTSMPPRGRCVRVTVTACGCAVAMISAAISAASASANTARSRNDHR